MTIALAIHGGAGAMTPGTYAESEIAAYQTSLKYILEKGIQELEAGAKALDVVVLLNCMFEDDSLFNAGRGSVFNSAGVNEMDASLMDGSTLRGAGITGLKKIKNPIRAAEVVLNHSPHTLLAGQDADEFCLKHGLELASAEYFHTDLRYNQWQKAKATKQTHLDHGGGSTVGAVALDQYGNLAAATSTGGMTNKYPGRVSDSAIIGAGTFADNKTCALSGTGTGDPFIIGSIAHSISVYMEYENLDILHACEKGLNKLNSLGGYGGIIGVDARGSLACPFNSKGMFRASYSSQQKLKKIGIYKD